jgi:tetratricopeptide (TPR) repeat protein
LAGFRGVKAMRPAARTAFVGRSIELNQLMRMLGAARHGEGQVALIEGPAGIGKTRLAEEIVMRAQRRGARVAIGRCWEDGEAPPLWPWLNILRDLRAPDGLLEEREGDASRGRFSRFLAVLEFFQLAPRNAPFVIVLDDVNVADSVTLLLARFLARERRRVPLLMLLTRRDQGPPQSKEVLELLSELGRDAMVITLPALSEDAIRSYFSASGLTPPEPQLLRCVATVTKGNPLHLRSLTLRSELDAGGVVGGVDHVVGALLEGLSPEDRKLLALAALLGPDVSAHEVARLAMSSPAEAAELLAKATKLGLVTELESGRFGFLHDLFRQTAMSTLLEKDRLDAHARATVLLSGHEPVKMLRRVHHALAAASRSLADASTAVAIAREAARTLRATDGFEPAAALLGRAVEIHDDAGLTNPAAELVVERAESVLACGRLAEARPLFQQAARVAGAEKNSVALARAALGLGGVWVGEHRLADDGERVRALQRGALEGLPLQETALRTRLAARLAAEEAYRGGSVAPVLEVVEAARGTGDSHALAEALSLCHHALLTPEHTWCRPALANELIAAAAAAGDGLLSLVGLCWRTVDLFLLGDPSAGIALEELRLRADTLRCRSILFIVRAMEVMLAIRGGRFDEAEEAATACFELGGEVGDADALAYRGAHLCAIRFFQGREAELADLVSSIATSPTLIEQRERAFGAAATLFALRAGRPEPAHALLERVRRNGLASIPFSSSWLLTMLVLVELASALGDGEIAEAAHNRLLPYADLPIIASLAVVCFGSVRRALGAAALACGKLDLAIEHFTGALAANERWGHRPAVALVKAELGLALLRRGGSDDVPRSRTLLQQAVAAGKAMAMTKRVEGWRAALARAESGARGREPDAAQMTLAEAGRWRVVLEGQIATVPDRVGMRYLARLVAVPDQSISALALVAQGTEAPPSGPRDALLDHRAAAEVRGRIRQLRQQPELSASEQEELAALTQELARATGLGGRIRSFADVPERARTAVRKAIKRAIDEISVANPVVGRHLAGRVGTGALCCYRVHSAPPSDAP